MASSARIDELRKKFDENPRRYFAPLANEYLKAGDIEQAIFICQEYLPRQPGHTSGYIVYGQALYKLARFHESRQVFETALSLDPENLIALRHLGDIARQTGDSRAAREWYQRVLEADPRNEGIAQALLELLATSSAQPERQAPIPAAEVPGLIEERSRYEGRLAGLEARRESIPQHVFERVQADYRARLERVAKQLASQGQAIEEEQTSVKSRLWPAGNSGAPLRIAVSGRSKTPAPTAFIAYSWDDDTHKEWVREFATRLRRDGIDVELDQWNAVPGDQLPAFMENAIRQNQFVLIVCTPGYKRRSDERKGGVGYEGHIITAEIASKPNHRKYIPILRSGDWNSAAPSWVVGKYYIDLSGAPYSQNQYDDLITTVYGARPTVPPLGPKPPSLMSASSQPVSPTNLSAWEPLRITGIIADKVTTPRSDEARGSALYGVPFRLSRRPPAGWDQAFVQHWNQPSVFTTMHRPGIASVEEDVIWLRGTTLEEVETVHRQTLKLAVDHANTLYDERRRLADAAERAAQERERAHKEAIQDAAKRITFD